MSDDYREPFLARCKRDREEYARMLAQCESGTFHLRRLQGGHEFDETPEHIERLKRIIAELEEIIASLEADRA